MFIWQLPSPKLHVRPRKKAHGVGFFDIFLFGIEEFHLGIMFQWRNDLVGGLVAILYFPINIGFLIIPIDELIFFRGVAQPPTSDGLHGSPLKHGDLTQKKGALT